MKTTVYLARHGEVHNPRKIVYGRLPGFGLTQRGHNQAKTLANFLAGKHITAVYSSPMQRTQETASHLLTLLPHLPLTLDSRLIEVASPLEGIPQSKLDPLGWDFYRDASLAAKGGERLEDIQDRMNDFLREAALKHSGEEVVAYSHGDPIMIMRAALRGLPVDVTTLRGEQYVGHAKGIKIEFTDDRPSAITDIML